MVSKREEHIIKRAIALLQRIQKTYTGREITLAAISSLSDEIDDTLAELISDAGMQAPDYILETRLPSSIGEVLIKTLAKSIADQLAAISGQRIEVTAKQPHRTKFGCRIVTQAQSFNPTVGEGE